jgi:vancomycin resistance protein YoaR
VRRAGTFPRNRYAAFDRPPVRPLWRFAGHAFGLLLVLGMLAFTATVGVQMAYTERVPAGVQVLNVDIGGRTRAEARGLLQAAASSMLRQPILLRVDDDESKTTPRDLGMTVDIDALLDQAYGVGREGNLVQRIVDQWSALVLGQRLLQSGIEFDTDQVEAVLQTVAADVDRPAKDAQVQLTRSDSASVSIVPEQPGTRLLVAQSAERVREALAGPSIPSSIELVTEPLAPEITTADWQQAKGQVERAIASPLTLTFEDRRWTIGRGEIAGLLVLQRTPGGSGSAVVNTDGLTARLDAIAKDIEQPTVDARFDWNRGNLKVVRESQEGRTLDADATKALVRERIFAENRTIPLAVKAVAPRVASTDGPSLDIQGLIRQGKTTFAGSVTEKQQNIALAASRLHGAVVPPGALFSFNKEVGPTTLDAGFKTGWGITLSSTGAKTIPSVAGGICQVATTLFHPVFHAGYAIEERHSHLYWIPSYGQAPLGMKGLDATVDEDYGLDLQFVNTTSDYLLIQGRVEGPSLIFELYGTKPTWDVKIDGPVITNTIAADRSIVRQSEPSMPRGRTLQVESAQDGFDVTITRTVTQGDDVRTLALKSHYVPSRNVVLSGAG